MGWWAKLREGRGLRPDIVAGREADTTVEMSGDLQAWLQAAFSAPDSVGTEASALARMRENAAQSAKEIRDVYDRAAEQHFALRWALVYAAGRLAEPATISFFESVLGAPIPPERSRDIHRF